MSPSAAQPAINVQALRAAAEAVLQWWVDPLDPSAPACQDAARANAALAVWKAAAKPVVVLELLALLKRAAVELADATRLADGSLLADLRAAGFLTEQQP